MHRFGYSVHSACGFETGVEKIATLLIISHILFCVSHGHVPSSSGFDNN